MTAKLITTMKISGEIIFIVLGGIELKESNEKLGDKKGCNCNRPRKNEDYFGRLTTFAP